MRKKIVAGNWKMNKTHQEALDLVNGIKTLKWDDNVNLIVCPPSLFTNAVVNELNGSEVDVGVQNCSEHASGAYTGEISVSMVSSVGAQYVILGHSERRSYFGEENDTLAKKVDVVLGNKLNPIYCCGELLEEREANNHFEVVKNQISEGLFHLSAEEMLDVVVAYEPVWAIGTGVTASPYQAQEMHAYIRSLLVEKYGEAVAAKISILYGGSCKPSNAKELFALEDVDGGLIGGASLVAEDFVAIANSF